jgi:hypothetical protein
VVWGPIEHRLEFNEPVMNGRYRLWIQPVENQRVKKPERTNQISLT